MKLQLKDIQNSLMIKKTKIKANTLFPYEIVREARKNGYTNNSTTRQAINKYWENQIDYLNGAPCRMMCVVDTSGSMTWSYYNNVMPIDVAISLGMYCAERIGEPFKDSFITFSHSPEFIKIIGVDFVDKVNRIVKRSQCEDTNIIATFNLLKNTIIKHDLSTAEYPDTLVIISDMQINQGSEIRSEAKLMTEMEKLRQEWEDANLQFPKLIYWNVNAVENTILDAGPNISYVSGCSPSIFKSILTGKSGWNLCLEAILADRYSNVHM